MRALEPRVNGFLNSLFQTAKHAAKTGNRLGLLSAGTSIASDIGANVYGAEISPQGNHLNVPETPVNESIEPVVSVKATTAEQPVKQATTRAEKTT